MSPAIGWEEEREPRACGTVSGSTFAGCVADASVVRPTLRPECRVCHPPTGTVVRMGFRRWLSGTFVTVDAIYGLILYAALIAAVSDDDSHPVDVLWVSVLSLVIFWGAHVYAGTIVNHAGNVPLHRAIGHAMKESSGMLWAAILPSVPIVLGALHVVADDDAVDWALFIVTVQLAVLGYVALQKRGANIAQRIFGAIGCALFGTLIIVLNAAVH